jgi:hypothetical protein
VPTYRNSHPNQYISFSHQCKSYNLGPGATLETPLHLEEVEWLKRISDEPFYNPLYTRHIFTGDKDSIHEFNVDTHEVQVVRVVTVPGSIDLFINDINNTPPIRVNNHFSFDVRSHNHVTKIIIQCIKKSEIEIDMYKYKENEF